MTRAAAVPSGALALAALAFGGLGPGVGAPAGAQLPDGRRALVLSAAATAGAERDRVLSPVRFDCASTGSELTAAAALGTGWRSTGWQSSRVEDDPRARVA